LFCKFSLIYSFIPVSKLIFKPTNFEIVNRQLADRPVKKRKNKQTSKTSKKQIKSITEILMRIKLLTSIMRIVGVLMIVSIIPSCAFATENNSPNQMSDMRLEPISNLTAGNFANVQTSILDSISKQITELQNLYTNISEASNATELKEVLSSHRPSNEFMGPDGMDMGPGHMPMGSIEMNGFNLDEVANVTDDNFSDVQKEIIDSLGNTTDMLNDHLNDTKVSQDSNRTEEINARITEIKNISTKVSGASTAAELKEVVFTFMQTQSVDSIEKEIEHLQTKVSENTSGNTTELSGRITELTTLKEKISGAESLEDLKTIMSSSHGIPGMREDMMKHGGQGGRECHMDKPD
jgi:hypothetical protein